ncbi:hypothetical protein ISF_00872 [Cordyceps fumosorosea ARSEF 2679]|uniref:Uncharacterized protein n=1 Tax=Cordyceps fumosorosea (strain ARSEF 2679) TaxID=1081104 RepID=A0A168EM20_CORFA|nr:hypothetical protein ISF_00872 [Cordyceps fumosorosea ARSEF 2679]OAA73971.1 hypothetical protein ISF_00872 [Cordyceps fumosorosea ARSEF 2679]
MSAINRSLEESRLEIMILAIGVLFLVSMLGLVVFINLRFKSYDEPKRRHDDYVYDEKPRFNTFAESVRRRSASLADNGKTELASLTRRATLSASADTTASGPDVKPQSEQRRFKLVPSTDTSNHHLDQRRDENCVVCKRRTP